MTRLGILPIAGSGVKVDKPRGSLEPGWSGTGREIPADQLPEIADPGQPPGLVGIQEAGIRGDAEAGEVEAVGVPAGADGGVVGMGDVGVAVTGEAEGLKLAFVERHESGGVEFAGESGPARAVAGVGAVVEAARVMEEGEIAHDGGVGSGGWGKEEPVALDPPPVADPVDAGRKVDGAGSTLDCAGVVTALGKVGNCARGAEQGVGDG